MSKKLSVLVALMMLFTPVIGASAESFSATAQGFHGEVTVTLDIEGDTLKNVTIDAKDETPAIGGAAAEKLAEAMLAANSAEVEAVTGATLTSNAVLTAAKEAVAASGAKLVANASASAVAEREDETTDVLVIGAGGAGLAAAIAANEAGASAILVEKLPFTGGCSAMSGGVITRGAVETDAPGSMTSEELFIFLMETSENRADETVVRKYIDSVTGTCNWIYDNMVQHPENVGLFPMIPENIVSPWLPGQGSEIVGDIAAYAMGKNIDIRTEVTATELISENGRVVGAVVRYADGGEQKIYAKGGVVLATGGFASSPEKLGTYSTPGADKIASYASAGTVGDGIEMAEKVGASVAFTEDWDTCGSFTSAFSLSVTGYDLGMLHKYMLINDAGERFVNEANIQPTIYTAMRHEIAKGHENAFWFIVDDRIDEKTQWLAETQGAIRVDSVEALAELTGAPVENLKATLEAYNAAANTDNDVFGKPAQYNLGLEAPFTVLFNQPMRTTTIGGLSITPEAEVLGTDGTPIPGLYAAGEVANKNFYGTIYTCGTAFGHAVVYGRIAGTNAAAAAK
ncbi:MAG: FAD-dependent oxidoreductase [Clostridia bacterium]|nr:FAD-dependent oxidoreductase [Clostridia bacterium]